ncbi:MAG: bifunctional nuclease family protein [Oligoflexia bacterium]|nr:bifunctional nuclease family protein [Oligoflexia bacterium]
MNERIRIFPNGLSLGGAKFRPSLIFKDKTERYVLPLWLDRSGVTLLLSQSDGKANSVHPYGGVLKIFDLLGVKITSVYFYDVRGQTQYALVEGYQGEKPFELSLRAEEIVGFSVNSGCEFWTNENVIEKSRVLNLDLIIRKAHTDHVQPMPDGLH